jgi:hypothetical protein
MRELRIPQVGELVMYTDKELTEYEPLFRDPNNLSEDADPYVKWIESDGPGIVLGIQLHVSGYSRYTRIKILAGRKIGWCYADYVEVIQ